MEATEVTSQEIQATFKPKGELAATARRFLRSTPQYRNAKDEGRAQEWLEAESGSMADYLYEAMTTRELED